MGPSRLDTAPQVAVENRDTLRAWLTENASTSQGAWAVTYKKCVADLYVSLSDVVDEALCFGWVDSLPRAKDEERTMLYICPRKAGANWSRVNKEKVARLIARGRMTKQGRVVIARSKDDGSWTALDDVEDLIIPADLQAGFDAQPGALANWDAFPRSVKRGALEILLNAKRAATRAAKIETIVTESAANRRPFQWKPK